MFLHCFVVVGCPDVLVLVEGLQQGRRFGLGAVMLIRQWLYVAAVGNVWLVDAAEIDQGMAHGLDARGLRDDNCGLLHRPAVRLWITRIIIIIVVVAGDLAHLTNVCTVHFHTRTTTDYNVITVVTQSTGTR